MNKKILSVLIISSLFVTSFFSAPGIKKTMEGKIEVMYDAYQEQTQAEPKFTGCQYTKMVDSLHFTPSFVYDDNSLTCWMQVNYSGKTSYSKIIFIGENNKMTWEFSSLGQTKENKLGDNPYANEVIAKFAISAEQLMQICEYYENNNPTIAIYNTKNQVEEMKPYGNGKRVKEYFKAIKEYYEKHELDKLIDAADYNQSQLSLTIK